MAIIVPKIKKVSTKLQDSKGKQLGVAEFNPSDLTAYQQFMKVTRYVHDTVGKLDDFQRIAASIPAALRDDADFQAAADILAKADSSLDDAVQNIEDCRACIDSVFGQGVFEIFVQGGKDITALLPLLDWATHHFKEARKEKIEKHTDRQSFSAVMD